MNNQPQHSMMSSVAGSSSQQRGLPSKGMYQLQSSDMAQLSHMQPQHQQQQQHQQSQMISGYSGQKTSDVASSQFKSDVLNLNGSAYQSLGGSSLHSTLNMDNNQMNIHQHNQPSSHQYNQQSQHQHQSSLQQQHYHSNPINHHHHQQQSQKPVTQQLLQPSHQYNIQPSEKTQQQQVSQNPQIKQMHHQQSTQQQRQQPYVHIQQRNSQQQPKYERAQQPRRILQNTNSMNHRIVTKDPSHNLYPTAQMKETTEPAVPNSNSDTSGIGSEEDSSINNKENKEGEIQELEITDDSGSASENKELANTKEKTPMTLVQELAKFNKIERKYTLLDEQGPAHKKTFYVKLQLGTEEYSSSGPSIRKAQQSAAAIALKETQFQDPPQKPVWKTRRDPGDDKLTPTVELNGLAMRRGEGATYKAIEPQQPPYFYPPGVDPRAMYSQRYFHHMRASRDPRYAARGYWPMRYHYPRMNRGFYVSLRVGHREFIGDGPTRQAARHNAAIKALKVLRNLPENEDKEDEGEKDEPVEDETVDEADALKSRVTSVHEIAFRRKLTVNFEVTRESGPPHMKTFTTRCTVGDLVTDGEGNSKKLSKKIASEEMYEKLKDLGSLPPCAVKPKQKMQVYKKKNRIKADIQQQKADPNYGVGVNPISRLIQIMCAQKKKEPVYTLVAERGVSCRKEFIMQIEVEGKTCNGSGPNKKLAKRATAEAMLDLLGYNKPSPQPAKSSIKQPSSEGQGSGNGEKKVHFSEICQKSDSSSSETKSGGPGLQQKVPGLLHLPSKTLVSTPASANSSNQSQPSISQSNPKESLVNLSSILKPNWRPELQLRELCKVLKYPLEINDFTKSQPNNSVEYMSRISIGGSGDNQQNFLGSSNSTVESARDMACMEALKVLMSRIKDMHPAGDGRSTSHVKKTVLSRTSSGLRDISH